MYLDLYKNPTNPPPPPPQPSSTQSSISTTTQKLTIEPKNIGVNEPKVSSQKKSEFSQNETRIADSQQRPTDEEKAGLNISTEMIYLMLIGKNLKKDKPKIYNKSIQFLLFFGHFSVLIAATLVGLTIAVICRLDCCGIKTKCCRQSHNRAETEDRVRPHEEIPLNKV